MQKWKCLKSEVAFDSRYFRVRKDLVELPSGQQKEWTYWDSNDSAMVLGMTQDKKLVMIKQYRYMVDDTVIEFPSGSCEKTETLEDGAKREFEEETGYVATSLTALGSFYETYGQLNRKMHFFFAENVLKTDKHFNSDDDVQEEIEVLLVGFERAVEKGQKKENVAMGSALAILLLKEKLKNNI